jgi:AcrR family transcriptional regulator
MTLQEHLQTATDSRTKDILDRIKAVFAAKGFDGASMQDLARGASMSAGNFYRYFPSKSAIVAAMVQRDLEEMEERFAQVRASDDPLPEFRRLLHGYVGELTCDDGPIWAEIQAASFRRPDIAALHSGMESEVLRNLVAVFARISGKTEDQARDSYLAHAKLVMILVHGLAVANAAAEGGRDKGLTDLVVSQVERIVGEIASGRTTCCGGADGPEGM